MDERLSDFAAGYVGDGVLPWLEGLELTAASDVKFFWPDSHACLCELEDHPGIERDGVLAMQTLYDTV